MKASNYTFPAIIFPMLLLLTSCWGSYSKEIITKDFEVTNFEALNLEVVGQVIFEQSSTPYLIAEGHQNLVEELEINQKDKWLLIKSEKERSFFKNKGQLTLKIGSPNLNEIHQSGVGTFLIKDNFDATSLTVKLTGVGDFTIDNCSLEALNLDSKAVGNCKIKGTASTVVISSDGVGNINCIDLIAKDAKIDSKGVGNISVYAHEKLDIAIKGIGNVTYAGNPSDLTTNKSGIGKVKSKS